MTYKILTEDNKIIHRAVARSGNKMGGFDNKKAKAAAPTKAPIWDQEKVIPETVSEEDDIDEEEEVPSTPQEDFVRSAKEDILKSLHQD